MLNKHIFTLATIFIVTVLWAIVGAHVFDRLGAHVPIAVRMIGRGAMFTATAFMLMEMWDAIADVQSMMLTVEWMRRAEESPREADAPEAKTSEPDAVRVATEPLAQPDPLEEARTPGGSKRSRG